MLWCFTVRDKIKPKESIASLHHVLNFFSWHWSHWLSDKTVVPLSKLHQKRVWDLKNLCFLFCFNTKFSFLRILELFVIRFLRETDLSILQRHRMIYWRKFWTCLIGNSKPFNLKMVDFAEMAQSHSDAKLLKPAGFRFILVKTTSPFEKR